MRKSELTGYEVRLLELSKRLDREIEGLEREIREGQEEQGDLSRLGTNADRDLEFLEVDEALEHNQVRLKNAVEAALTRIEQGTYGQCTHCGREIARTRLDAIPYASLCYDCGRTQA
jgi:RNA polymerase-binding transcription factor DksA